MILSSGLPYLVIVLIMITIIKKWYQKLPHESSSGNQFKKIDRYASPEFQKVLLTRSNSRFSEVFPGSLT